MTDNERLQAFRENLFDIRRCINEGVPCPYGICSECIASNNYRDFLSLIHTDLTDEELREKEYNNYEQRRKEAEWKGNIDEDTTWLIRAEWTIPKYRSTRVYWQVRNQIKRTIITKYFYSLQSNHCRFFFMLLLFNERHSFHYAGVIIPIYYKSLLKRLI